MFKAELHDESLPPKQAPCLLIHTVYKSDKMYYRQAVLGECKYIAKKKLKK